MIFYTDNNIKEWLEKSEKEIIGQSAYMLAQEDKLFTLVYADVGSRLFIDKLKEVYPECCLEAGIAEQNMISMASAMANEGYHVFAVAYAPFITARVLEHIRVNLGYMKSAVKLIGLSAGIAASDLGATHTSLDDIAMMRCIQDLTIVSPADNAELVKVMEYSCKSDKPMYIRLTSNVFESTVHKNDFEFKIEVAEILKEGKDIAIIAYGYILQYVLSAVKKLEEDGVSCKVINMHTIQPLDKRCIDAVADYKMIVTVEEHWINGGMGAAISDYLAQKEQHAPIRKIGFENVYLSADTSIRVLEKEGLTPEIIYKKISSFYNEL